MLVHTQIAMSDCECSACEMPQFRIYKDPCSAYLILLYVIASIMVLLIKRGVLVCSPRALSGIVTLSVSDVGVLSF